MPREWHTLLLLHAWEHCTLYLILEGGAVSDVWPLAACAGHKKPTAEPFRTVPHTEKPGATQQGKMSVMGIYSQPSRLGNLGGQFLPARRRGRTGLRQRLTALLDPLLHGARPGKPCSPLIAESQIRRELLTGRSIPGLVAFVNFVKLRPRYVSMNGHYA
jgi:hypothetical protein